jgi:hypothetical protein
VSQIEQTLCGRLGNVTHSTASKNCGNFLASNEAKHIQELWLDWMRDEYGISAELALTLFGLVYISGGELHGDKEAVPPSVYPDTNGWPMLLPLDELKLGIEKEKLLLRRYFTLTSSES